MSEPSGYVKVTTQATIPPDGHYWATVFHDTGGSIRTPVKVVGGEVFTYHGWRLLPEACSDFTPLCREERLSWWPAESVKEWRELDVRVQRLELVLNRILDNSGHRGTHRSIGFHEAQADAEELLKETRP